MAAWGSNQSFFNAPEQKPDIATLMDGTGVDYKAMTAKHGEPTINGDFGPFKAAWLVSWHGGGTVIVPKGEVATVVA